jgi:hypothetical protein
MDARGYSRLDTESDDEIFMRILTLCQSGGGLVSSQFRIDADHCNILKQKMMKSIADEITRFRNFDKELVETNELKAQEEKRLWLEGRDKLKQDFLFLEGIIQSVVPTVKCEFAYEHNQLVKEPGLYFLITLSDGLIYVGQATSIHGRLNTNHHIYGKLRHVMVCQAFPIHDQVCRDNLEIDMIRKCHPLKNVRRELNKRQKKLQAAQYPPI